MPDISKHRVRGLFCLHEQPEDSLRLRRARVIPPSCGVPLGIRLVAGPIIVPPLLRLLLRAVLPAICAQRSPFSACSSAGALFIQLSQI